MEIIRLCIAVLMPWMTGYLLLMLADHFLSSARKKNVLRQLGYGFFIGYAALYGIMILTTEIFGSYSFNVVFIAITTLAMSGAVLVMVFVPVFDPVSLRQRYCSGNRLERVLWILLAAWILLHLSLAVIEVLHRPIYPWDAWLTWMYRAKAWFLTSTIDSYISPLEWKTGEAISRYNIPGNDYPKLVSSVGLWSSSALGRWDEALVNLPVISLGFALCIGLYGQCRELGANRLLATAGVYLFVSIPLVGTHLSLAGQADTWMSGYIGLGLIAIIAGINNRDRSQIILGLAMSTAALAIKSEGLVWLSVSFGILLAFRFPRGTIIAVAFLSIAAILATAGGTAIVELPVIGTFGYREGIFYLPFVGKQSVISLFLWDDYYEDFFKRDSWHLLWGLLILSLPLVWLLKASYMRRIVISFYLLLALTQSLIFGFSDQGQWAEDGTAINRLPMHFAPVLIFCLVVIAAKYLEFGYKWNEPTSNVWGARIRPEAWFFLIILLSTAIMSAGVYTYLQPISPKQSIRYFPGENLRFVLGKGHREDGVTLVDDYESKIAIVSSGNIAVRANDLQILGVDLNVDGRENAEFFWRKAAGSEMVNSIHVGGSGQQTIDLSKHRLWEGTITEVGLIFSAQPGREASFRSFSLMPRTLGAQLSVIWSDWAHFEPWNQASAHWIAGGRRAALLSMPLLVLCWLGLVLLFFSSYTLFRVRPSSTIKLALLTTLLAWMILDIRWTANRIRQAIETVSIYPLNSQPSHLDIGGDGETLDLINSVKSQIDRPESQVLITSIDPKMRFQMFRAKYHLLPYGSYVHEGDLKTSTRTTPHFVVLLAPPHLESGDAKAETDRFKDKLESMFRARVTLTLSHEAGFVYRISPR